MSRLVLDASVALCWLFDDQATAYTESVLDRLVGGDTVVAPALWPLEIANVVTLAERRRIVNSAQAAAFSRHLASFRLP